VLGQAAKDWARKLAPWVVAAAILSYLFTQVPLSEAWQAAREARLALFLSAVLVAVGLWFTIDSAAYAYLFSRFNAPLSWAEARSLRGMTYLLTPINWNVATAAVVLHLRRSKNVGALESTSSILFYSLIDGIVLAGLVLVGVWQLPPSPEIVSLRNVAAAAAGILLALLAVFMAPAPAWRWLQRLRGLGVFRTHGLATLRDLGWLMLLRSSYFLGFVTLFWLGPYAFGVHLSPQLAMAATPAILMAGALPITPAGLGTQQAAMLFFFSPHGEPAPILAFGLALPVAITLGRCLLGLVYLRDLERLRRA
jgi:uncharacterized membrane protein YbhN (UPF0104 family)